MIFVDTGYLIALVSSHDEHHVDALEWKDVVESEQVPLLTTEFCLLEVVNFLSDLGHRRLGHQVVDSMRSGANVTVVGCSSELLDRGLVLHSQRDDKDWGLTDCISFVVAAEYGISEALGFDDHFVQANLRVLPLEPLTAEEYRAMIHES